MQSPPQTDPLCVPVQGPDSGAQTPDESCLLRESTMMFAESVCASIRDMCGAEASVTSDSYRETAPRTRDAMVSFCFFAGTVNGQYVLTLPEKAGRDMLLSAGVTVPGSEAALREDVGGLVAEVVNLSVAKAIGCLEPAFGSLTFVPPSVGYGTMRFPDIRAGTVDIQVAGHAGTCSLLLNLVNLKIARRLEKTEELLETRTQEALTDGLTQLFNRAQFESALPESVKTAEAGGEPLSLLILDVDNFKQFNDTYGHQTGDDVLKLVAESIGSSLRGSDLAARYGGDEFVALLPGATARQAVVVGERIRSRARTLAARAKASGGAELPVVTLSIGGAQYCAGDSPKEFFERADTMVYRAKEGGRDQVIVEVEE